MIIYGMLTYKGINSEYTLENNNGLLTYIVNGKLYGSINFVTKNLSDVFSALDCYSVSDISVTAEDLEKLKMVYPNFRFLEDNEIANMVVNLVISGSHNITDINYHINALMNGEYKTVIDYKLDIYKNIKNV